MMWQFFHIHEALCEHGAFFFCRSTWKIVVSEHVDDEWKPIFNTGLLNYGKRG